VPLEQIERHVELVSRRMFGQGAQEAGDCLRDAGGPRASSSAAVLSPVSTRNATPASDVRRAYTSRSAVVPIGSS